jgi:hypothetical protein
MKIKELPSTNPKPEDVAKVAEGHVSMFNGIDLTGWKTEKDSWKVSGEKLVASKIGDLKSEKKIGPGELFFDWKIPASSQETWFVQIGSQKSEIKAEKPGKWQRQLLAFDTKFTPDQIVFKGMPGLEIMNVFYLQAKAE